MPGERSFCAKELDMKPFVSAAATLSLAMLAASANAHPRLVSISPGPNSVATSSSPIAMQFSERLLPRFSGADLIMFAPNGQGHKLASLSSVGPDGRTLSVKPQTPLRHGRYRVIWHAVSTDTHRVMGRYAFAVN